MIADLVTTLLPANWTGESERPRNAASSSDSITSTTLGLDTSEGWSDLLGETDSGIRVNHYSALTLAPVWQSVAMISGDLASLTLDCYHRLPEDDREIASDHSSELVVSCQWNEETSAFEGWRRVMVHALIWGNGYVFIEREGRLRTGRILGLYNLLPDRTTTRRDEDGRLFYVTEVNGQLEPLFLEEVLHIKGMSVRNGVGLDVVYFARQSIGLALAAEGFASKFFSNGAQVGGVLTVPATYSDQAVKKVEEGWSKKYHDKKNWFKIAILRDGSKFEATTQDAQKSQQHELRVDQAHDIARFFNLPPFKLGIPGSVSYNSAEQGQLAYLISCLNHWKIAVSSECNLKLLAADEKATHYFEHNVSNWIEIDYKTMNEVLEIQRRNEVINGAEWRRKINLPKRTDAKALEYVNPNTKSAAGGESNCEPPLRDLLDVPDRRQEPYPYACGDACVWAVADFFEAGENRKLRDYIRELGTKPTTGTAPEAMTDWFNEHGLFVNSGQGMTISDLGRFTQAGQPVICAVQMYNGGHWVVVIGVGLGQVFFHDPVAGRRMLSSAEFDTLWHDTEADGGGADHFGLAVGASLSQLHHDDEAAGSSTESTNAETDTSIVNPVPTDTGTATGGDVQATALNGAQVQSLVEVLDKLAQGQWPEKTTEAAIRAAFPGTPDALITQMVESLRSVKPPEPVAVPNPDVAEGGEVQ